MIPIFSLWTIDVLDRGLLLTLDLLKHMFLNGKGEIRKFYGCHHKNNVRYVHLYLQLFVWGLMSYLRYLCLFAHSGVQHILCCVFVFVLFFLVLCTLCCPLLIAPSVFSKVYWLNVTEYMCYKLPRICSYEYLCYKWSRICCYGIYVLQMTTDLLLRNICVTNDHGFVVTEYLY